MANKLPALHFYTGDWWKDPGIMALNYGERGVWVQMLFLMHESKTRGKLSLNGKPYPIKDLARVININPNMLQKIIKRLIEVDIVSIEDDTQILYSRRMISDEEKRQILVKAGCSGGRGNKKEKAPPFKKEKGLSEDEVEDENKKGLDLLNNEPIYSGNVQDLNLAESLAQDFCKFHKEDIPIHGIYSWADEISDMRKFDKRTHAQILEKWEWANAGWWRENGIRMTPKMLRGKWLTIKKPGRNNGSGNGSGHKYDGIAPRRDLARDELKAKVYKQIEFVQGEIKAGELRTCQWLHMAVGKDILEFEQRFGEDPLNEKQSEFYYSLKAEYEKQEQS